MCFWLNEQPYFQYFETLKVLSLDRFFLFAEIVDFLKENLPETTVKHQAYFLGKRLENLLKKGNSRLRTNL